jgi:hypothetical protein
MLFDLFETDGADKTTFKNLTLKQSGSSGTTYVFYGGKENGATKHNVHLIDCDIHAKEYAVRYVGPLSKFERCRFTRTTTGNSNYIFAIRVNEGGITVDSCLFEGWYDTAIYCETVGAGVTIRNCTIIGHASTSDDYGIYTQNGATIYNTIVYSNPAAKLDRGIRFQSANSGNTIKNCIAFGEYNDDDFYGTGAPTVSANLYDNADVLASSPGVVFVNLAGGDYHPNAGAGSIALGGGDTTSYPTTDIDGNSFDSPPSIGCYEAPSAGGGSPLAAQAPALGMNNPFSLDL